ncbi:hypothetical protein [Novosphingobium sp. CECT 9465]|uniref:hypothetical protein n=1 Tax=Novosphingobium sp. CECT 9465 TaxID=2829794 RepID=UPI001E4A54D2|nr:hypothetical protein [Novosphingobium sp. CECT 9465]CAH0498520.1 hypothetical protein NVSP9465_03608 [Novosphingobium sp. CECT 9465]
MLTDSERFAFTVWRIHAFGSSGNAYDAVQTDESIAAGETLLILDERVVGVAMTWPFAITAEAGKLHAVCEPGAGETLGHIEKALDVPDGSIARACRLARTLGFAIDAGLVPVLPELPATEVEG